MYSILLNDISSPIVSVTCHRSARHAFGRLAPCCKWVLYSVFFQIVLCTLLQVSFGTLLRFRDVVSLSMLIFVKDFYFQQAVRRDCGDFDYVKMVANLGLVWLSDNLDDRIPGWIPALSRRREHCGSLRLRWRRRSRSRWWSWQGRSWRSWWKRMKRKSLTNFCQPFHANRWDFYISINFQELPLAVRLSDHLWANTEHFSKRRLSRKSKILFSFSWNMGL